MVPEAGSAEIVASWAGTLGASVRQPEVSVALQWPMLVTLRMRAPPTFTTYAVLFCGTRVTAFGNELNPGSRSGVACSFLGRPAQPEVVVPLHVLVSMNDSVSSKWFTAKTVPEGDAGPTTWVLAPVFLMGHAWLQPEVTRALQTAPLMTETVPSL